MKSEATELCNLLRCLLDATNQQFTHILALQKWNQQAAALRITEVDDLDFASAMGIIDHLVKSGDGFLLEAAVFNPGTDYRSILQAEQAIEARMAMTISSCDSRATRPRRLVDAARAPRAAYARWLTSEIAAQELSEPEITDHAETLKGLVANLVTMLEQSMIHAFVEWHGGNQTAADCAWASSGAAMMQLTRLVRLFATLPGVPHGGQCPPPAIEHRAGRTLDADRSLAGLCAQQAELAAQRCEHPALAKYCASIAGYYRQFILWSPTQPHPAASTNPAVFHSFAATLAKFMP